MQHVVAQGDDHPVVCVSWNDATAFCEWLTKKEGRTYQLPTEGQWEYACRAGTDTEYWWGDQMDTTGKVANVRDTGNWPVPSAPFNKMPMNDGYKFTAPVGSYRPNAWDLHDMIGNAMEWCADWYGPYSSGNQTDPTGAASGEGRVLRGGSGLYLANGCRSAIRDSDAPDGRYNNHGFRVVSGTE